MECNGKQLNDDMYEKKELLLGYVQKSKPIIHTSMSKRKKKERMEKKITKIFVLKGIN